VIPTPDASTLIDPEVYESIYESTFHLPKSLIKFSTLAEEVIGALYNMSEQDFEWFQTIDPGLNLSVEDCESILYTIDVIGSDSDGPALEQVMAALELYPEVLKFGAEAIEIVYNYWKDLRYSKQKGHRIRKILKVFIM
jgi:hypothetical protein